MYVFTWLYDYCVITVMYIIIHLDTYICMIYAYIHICMYVYGLYVHGCDCA